MNHNHASSHPTRNPLMGGCLGLNSLVDLQDALAGCEASLFLLADLFGSESDDFEILNTQKARLGMFWQLRALAGMLETINERLAELTAPKNPGPTND